MQPERHLTRWPGLVCHIGGPSIDSVAKKGNAQAIQFPRAYIDEDHFDFSFSGLKTAVINYLHSLKQRNGAYRIEDVAASFQQAGRCFGQ